MKKSIFIFILVLSSILSSKAQLFKKDQAFAHTFSIVARDSITGEMAVAVQSHWFAVGTLVCWAKSGVGVVATQSFINPAFGPQGLALMEKGKTAKEALEQMIKADPGRDLRQLALLDVHGQVFSYTGANCVQSAHHIIGKNFAVQANMMLNDEVVPAMAKAFRKNANLPLAERVLQVLLAAQEAGGDIRGKQSAALLVVGPKKVPEWKDKLVDLRVDDNPEPLSELSRLLIIHRAYEHMNNGDLAVENKNMPLALKEYGAAEKLQPANIEMKFWTAITLSNNGKINQALPLFKLVFEKDSHWKEMTKRLPKAGLLNVSKKQLDSILNQ